MSIWTARKYVGECEHAKDVLKIKKKALGHFVQQEERTSEEGRSIISDRLDAYHAFIQELRILHKYFIDVGKERMSFMANTFIILSFIGFIPAVISSLDALRDQRGLGIAIISMMCGCTVCALAYVIWYRAVPSIVHHIVLGPLFAKHQKVFGSPVREDEHCCQCQDLSSPYRMSRDTDRTTIIQTPPVSKDNALQKLEIKALQSSQQIFFFLRVFPVLEVFNAIIYMLIILCQSVIVVVLRVDEQAKIEHEEGSSDNEETPFRSASMQWIFTFWILVMNILFSLCNHSPSPIVSFHHSGFIKKEEDRRPW